MPLQRRTILIEPLAPPKPAWGAACNGCGVCCLAEPCPLGVVLSGRRKGACAALQWDEGGRLYRCGAVVAPRQVLQDRWPILGVPLRRALAAVLGKVAGRWIAAGQGCDSSLEVLPGSETIPRKHQDSHLP